MAEELSISTDNLSSSSSFSISSPDSTASSASSDDITDSGNSSWGFPPPPLPDGNGGPLFHLKSLRANLPSQNGTFGTKASKSFFGELEQTLGFHQDDVAGLAGRSFAVNSRPAVNINHSGALQIAGLAKTVGFHQDDVAGLAGRSSAVNFRPAVNINHSGALQIAGLAKGGGYHPMGSLILCQLVEA